MDSALGAKEAVLRAMAEAGYATRERPRMGDAQGGGFPEWLPWLLIALLAVALVLLVAYAVGPLGWGKKAGRGKQAADSPGATPAIQRARTGARTSAELLAEAQRRYEAGDQGGAAELLYRGMLRRLREEGRLRLEESSTAIEAARALSTEPERLAAFRSVAARAHRARFRGDPISRGDWGEMGALARRWFGGEGAA